MLIPRGFKSKRLARRARRQGVSLYEIFVELNKLTNSGLFGYFVDFIVDVAIVHFMLFVSIGSRVEQTNLSIR